MTPPPADSAAAHARANEAVFRTAPSPTPPNEVNRRTGVRE